MLAFFGQFSTIEAEALGTLPLLFSFCQLPICIEDITKLPFWLVRILSRWWSSKRVWRKLRTNM